MFRIEQVCAEGDQHLASQSDIQVCEWITEIPRHFFRPARQLHRLIKQGAEEMLQKRFVGKNTRDVFQTNAFCNHFAFLFTAAGASALPSQRHG